MLGASRRRRSAPDRFLYAKMAAFFLGAGFFFGGVLTGRDWAVLVAAVVLVVGLALRFADRRDADGAGKEEEEAEGGEGSGLA
ncbi:MAG TPA: hypothetical protein VFQ76_11205 [Longimicrobiaceae bacterium]|nr:hypothetical protein [Longimicrobiaceae bacterium]